MNTHVLIVDSTTFRYHLEYLFFGTGAKDSSIDFSGASTTKLHATTENMLLSMIADGMRVRKGDNIIFYLQQNTSEKIYEGKFYGIFKATSDGVFLDNIGKDQYLHKELGKSLTFRNLIRTEEVYPIGVTEWEALDEIRNIHSPNQMLWSLIYRKLKGNRGNTMITEYEAERLIHLIRCKNSNQAINGSNKLTFDSSSQLIKTTNDAPIPYRGRKDPIDIMPRLHDKFVNNKAYEAHLQAYITQNLGMKSNQSLDQLFTVLPCYKINWIGNEVSCGVGMQRIDIAVELIKDSGNPHRIVVPIELKARACEAGDIKQIYRYIIWLQQYYLPNRPGDIQPILIGDSCGTTSKRNDLIKEMKKFNTNSEVNPILYYETSIGSTTIRFDHITY